MVRNIRFVRYNLSSKAIQYFSVPSSVAVVLTMSLAVLSLEEPIIIQPYKLALMATIKIIRQTIANSVKEIIARNVVICTPAPIAILHLL